MLARYMPSSCVRACVSSHAGIESKRHDMVDGREAALRGPSALIDITCRPVGGIHCVPKKTRNVWQ